MNKADKEMMDRLMQDKGETLKVLVDNDVVFVVNKNTEEDVHDFIDYGWVFIAELMRYLGLDAEEV